MKLVSVIRRNTSLFKKISRFLGYFMLLIGLGYQTQRLYKKLKVEPEIFSKESSVQSSEIPFPAFTVCPPNSIKNEAWSHEFLKLNNLTENDLRAASLQTCPNIDIFMQYENSDVNVVDVLLKASPNFADVVFHCGTNEYWMNLQDCDKLFVRSVTEYGICYTFNMLGHDLVFNESISSDFDTFKRTKIVKIWNSDEINNETRHGNDTEPRTWNLESGYSSDDEFVQPARALKMQTLTFGTTNKVNDSICEIRGRKYKMMLHLPNELPQISHETIDILIGKEKILLISAKVTHNEESLRHFHPLKRGCYYEGEKTLKVFKSYTKANCEYECMTNFAYSTCGCVKFSMPRTKDMKVCDYDRYACISVITSVFPRSYYSNHENKKKFPDYPCGCLPSCTEIKYKIIKDELIDKESIYITSTHMHALINVIFADSQIEKTSNYVTYNIENFIFDIGGLIGLFLGFSLLSVLGLLHNICKTIKNRCNKAVKWFQRRINHSSNSMELQQVQRFETVLEFPFEEIASVNNVGTSTSDLNQRLFTISVEQRNIDPTNDEISENCVVNLD